VEETGTQHNDGAQTPPPPSPAATDAKTKSALNIYAALLGRQVNIDPDAVKPEKGVEIRFSMQSSIKLGGTRERSKSPLKQEPTLLDHVGQWLANAIHAIDRARQRIVLPKSLRSVRKNSQPEVVANASPRTVETSVIMSNDEAATRPEVEMMVTPAATLMNHKPVILVGPAVLKQRARSKAHAA
jgi:hypothetical protein